MKDTVVLEGVIMQLDNDASRSFMSLVVSAASFESMIGVRTL